MAERTLKSSLCRVASASTSAKGQTQGGSVTPLLFSKKP
jgi:hypothetical protein